VEKVMRSGLLYRRSFSRGIVVSILLSYFYRAMERHEGRARPGSDLIIEIFSHAMLTCSLLDGFCIASFEQESILSLSREGTGHCEMMQPVSRWKFSNLCNSFLLSRGYEIRSERGNVNMTMPGVKIDIKLIPDAVLDYVGEVWMAQENKPFRTFLAFLRFEMYGRELAQARRTKISETLAANRT